MTKPGSIRQGPLYAVNRESQVNWILAAVGWAAPPTQARNDSQPATVSAWVNPQCVGTPSTTIAVVRFPAGTSLAYSPSFSTSTRPSLSVCRETILVFPTFPVGV